MPDRRGASTTDDSNYVALILLEPAPWQRGDPLPRPQKNRCQSSKGHGGHRHADKPPQLQCSSSAACVLTDVGPAVLAALSFAPNYCLLAPNACWPVGGLIQIKTSPCLIDIPVAPRHYAWII